MHDKTNERYEAMVQRTFGPGAELAGSMGTPAEPGAAEIRLDGRVIGTGPTFEAALQQAQTTAAGLARDLGRRRQLTTVTKE